jgi:uncharacterized protein (TIRG00374 family)
MTASEPGAPAPPRVEDARPVSLAGIAPPSPEIAPASAPARTGGAKKRSSFWTLLKFLIAAAVIAVLAWTGALDFKKVGTIIAQPTWLVEALLLTFAQTAIVTIRWWLLLRLEKIEISLTAALKLTLVGSFWNGMLPGSVSGDLFKMYYIGRLYPQLKAEAYTTVMIDRIVGLAALVFLSFGSALANLDFIRAPGHESLQWTFLGNALAAAGFAFGILALVLGVGRRSSFADRMRERLPFVESIRRGYRALIRLGERPGILASSFILGMLSHMLLCCVALISGHALGESNLSVSTYFFVVPVGLFVNSIPFGFPGGIGAGETAFNQLFKWAGGFDPSGAPCGANVMLLIRVASLAVGQVGGIIYIFDRKVLSPPDDATPCEEKS